MPVDFKNENTIKNKTKKPQLNQKVADNAGVRGAIPLWPINTEVNIPQLVAANCGF